MGLEKIVKSVKKVFKKSLLVGTLTAASLLGCGDGDKEYIYLNPATNQSPVVQQIPDQTVQECGSLSLNLGAYVSDEEGDITMIKQLGGPGSITNNIYQYQDQRDFDEDNDEHTVSFKVTDTYNNFSIGSFKIIQQDMYGPNRDPVIQNIPDQTVQEGQQFALNLENYVSDEDNDPLTIELLSGPGSIDNKVYQHDDPLDTGKENDEYTVMFKVTDGNGGLSIGTFKLTQQDAYYRLTVTFFDSKVNWICYAPTNFNPNILQFPDETSVRADLRALVNANFKGLVTYGSDNILGSVPRLAKEEGFTYVIMGVWDFNNSEEWNNAVNAAQYVDGYCVGNEGLLANRYILSTLLTKINQLRLATDKPVTTTEPIASYSDSDLLNAGDWVFPNTHPYWNNITVPDDAANWTLQQYQSLADATSQIVVLKEVGLPSAGDSGLSETVQNQYYRKLEDLTQNYSGTTYVYFEAFDQPWKTHAAVEPHWGLFNQDRSTKDVSKPQIIFTSVPAKGSHSNLFGRTVNIKPSNYKVSTYIYVQGLWWMKPYWNNPLTTISQNSTWLTDITTGGTDSQATGIYSAIVTPDYVPVANTLPSISNPKVIAETSTTR